MKCHADKEACAAGDASLTISTQSKTSEIYEIGHDKWELLAMIGILLLIALGLTLALYAGRMFNHA